MPEALVRIQSENAQLVFFTFGAQEPAVARGPASVCGTTKSNGVPRGNMTPPVSIPHFGTQKAEGWDLHLRQNAFGLLIARDPYRWEMCDEPGLMRGGDGGTALHVGAGTFAGWLTLASAFQRQWNHEIFYGAHLRRAFSLF